MNDYVIALWIIWCYNSVLDRKHILMFFVISILAVDNVTKTSIETSQHLYLRDLIDSMLIEMGNVR